MMHAQQNSDPLERVDAESVGGEQPLNEDPVPIKIGVLPVLAGQLREVVDEFEAFGVPIHPKSRLPQVLAALEETAEAGAFPEAPAELRRIGVAIGTAQEFVEIGNVLPPEPVEGLRIDLRHAVRGPLVHTTGDRMHLQFQSQLWVGAMLVRGGASTGVLTREEGKNPDFILSNGLSEYAVEVKRPRGALRAQRIVSRAARQIRDDRFHGGMIVVDLTDVIGEETLITVAARDVDLAPAHAALEERTSALHREVFTDDESLLRTRREHVFGLVAFARVLHWDTRDLSQPHLGRVVATVNYWRNDGRTLRAHRARWLGRLIHEGIQGVGHAQQGEVELNL